MNHYDEIDHDEHAAQRQHQVEARATETCAWCGKVDPILSTVGDSGRLCEPICPRHVGLTEAEAQQVPMFVPGASVPRSVVRVR